MLVFNLLVQNLLKAKTTEEIKKKNNSLHMLREPT